ncbi:MAG: hypothetical protein IJY66_02760 [Clostridia bacterium]|nr:hypothetical protein [Clostridia bacterium]
MKKLLLCTLLLLSMLVTLVVPAYAELDEPIMLDDCDTSTWHGAGGKDFKEYTQGKASTTWTVGKGGSFVVFRTWSTPVNATGANYLEFDFYVSSADMFYSISGGNSLEITSGGTCDKEETAWNLTDLEVEDGWNHIALLIGGGCDFSRVNYMRFYALSHNNDEPYTIKIDNIQFTYRDPDDVGGFEVPEDYIIGSATKDTAVPLIPTSEDNPVGTPDEEKQPEGEVQPDDSDAAQTPAPLLGIVLLVIAGVVLLTLLALVAMKKANRTVIIILSAVTALALIGGIIGLVSAGGEVPGEQEGDDPTDLPGEQPDTPQTPDDIKASLPDQTGHPEISADSVDVEALLKVNPDFNTKEAYKVTYSGTKAVTDYSALPHILMTETPVENGITMQALSPDEIQKMTIAEKECWLFVHFRKQDTNKFRLSLDDATAEQFKDKTLRLNFITYVNMDTVFTVEYMDADGNAQTATSAANRTRNAWTEYHVDLVNPAFDGSKDGHDFFITCEGPELIRIHAIYATEGSSDANSAIQTGLIKTDYEQSFYIVAEENVRSYGAIGDGYANDTEAFQSAIDAVGKKGGGTVFVPAGIYCLTKPLVLPTSVALVGELEPGTANGTVLAIYHGKGETNPDQAAVVLNHQSSVQSIAFWYPEQTIVNGNFIPYPSTLTQRGSEGTTVRNVTFVNAYVGVNYGTLGGGQASNSLQYTRDIYGTCLSIGYHNDPSYDIGKLENFHFSPDYWLDSGLPGTPNEALLRTWMLRNSTAIWLQRIDWTYIADIFVDGYHKGIYTSRSSTGTPNGHMYNIHLLDCYYPYYAEELSWTIASKCHLRAVGNDGATALYFGPNCSGDMVFVDATIESEGANAILNYGKSKISLTGCTVTSKGTAYANMTGAKASFINTTLTGGDGRSYDVVTDDQALPLPDVDYGKTVVIKPKSDKFINLTEAPYNAPKNGGDITATLQKAIDDLKETGGMVYLPAGTYTLSDHIDVWAGIEIRGAAIWSHSFAGPTQINTAFGHNDPNGEALFDLYEGAGLVGISVVYNKQNTNDLQEYSFTVRGRGANVYLMDVTLPTSWNGVDFASYRCDNHYIEYLHGCFLNQGIVIGAGSENGIVRDCHLTPNCFCVHSDANWWTGPYVELMTHGTPYVIGESKNQILYHNFTYGAYQGLVVLDGAEDAYVLSHGVDSGDISAYFSGDCSVTLVNTELVNLFTAGTAKHFNYVYTAEDFSGTLNMINTAGWGTSRNAFNLNGDGHINITGSLITAAGAPLMNLNAGSATVIGLINDTRTTDFKAGDFAISLHIAGNILNSGLRIDPSFEEVGADITGADLEIYQK